MNLISNIFSSSSNHLPPIKKLAQKPIVYAIAAVALSVLAYLTFLFVKYLTTKTLKESSNVTPIQPNQSPNSTNDTPPNTPNKVDLVATNLLDDQQENLFQPPLSDTDDPLPLALPTIDHAIQDIPEDIITPDPNTQETLPPQPIIEDFEVVPNNQTPVDEPKVEPKIVTFEEAQQALEEGIEVSAEIKERLKQLILKITKKTKDNDLSFLKTGQLFSVFTIPEAPDLVFKIGSITGYPQNEPKITRKRFHNIVKGKQVIMQYDLNRLHIPPTTLLEFEKYGYKYAIVAEKRLPITGGHYKQEDLYYKHAASLKPLVKQLARFIFETNLEDVGFSHCPILEYDEKTNEISIGMISLENLGKEPVSGFIGGEHHGEGLLGMMVNEELIDMVIEECNHLGISLDYDGLYITKSIEGLKYDQLAKIDAYHKYQQFLEAKNIHTGHEPIMSIDDIDQLGLDLDEKGSYTYSDYDPNTFAVFNNTVECTLRDAVKEIITFFNKELENPKNSEHVKRIRTIKIPNALQQKYQNLDLPYGTRPQPREEEQLWINRILRALTIKGYIFQLTKDNMKEFVIKC